MSSSDPDDRLDLERGLPVTPADVMAQRRLRTPSAMTPEEYMAFLDSLPEPTYEQLRNRRGPRGEPFEL
jgi:hypothetical protein